MYRKSTTTITLSVYIMVVVLTCCTAAPLDSNWKYKLPKIRSSVKQSENNIPDNKIRHAKSMVPELSNIDSSAHDGYGEFYETPKRLLTTRNAGYNVMLRGMETNKIPFPNFIKPTWSLSGQPIEKYDELDSFLPETDDNDFEQQNDSNGSDEILELTGNDSISGSVDKRQDPNCDTTRMTLNTIIEYLRTGKVCGYRAPSVRFGVGR